MKTKGKKTAAKTGRKTPVTVRVSKHRAALRKAGLRPIQIWVPDTRSKEFAAEVKRTANVLANSPHERELLNFIEQVQDYRGWK